MGKFIAQKLLSNRGKLKEFVLQWSIVTFILLQCGIQIISLKLVSRYRLPSNWQ